MGFSLINHPFGGTPIYGPQILSLHSQVDETDGTTMDSIVTDWWLSQGSEPGVSLISACIEKNTVFQYSSVIFISHGMSWLRHDRAPHFLIIL